MTTGTVRLHRVLRAHPESVYRAFLDADAIGKWLPPYGFTCKVEHMDVRVAGTFQDVVHRISRRGLVIRSAASIGELVPDELISLHRQVRRSELARRNAGHGVLKQVSCGTEISVVQEGIPEVIPPEMCYLGWQESLAQLATSRRTRHPGVR